MTTLPIQQQTLASSISRSGIGLHSARLVDITIHPAPVDTSIVFRRIDITGVDNDVPALSSNIADTMLNSQIMNSDGVTVGTVEHLMAAFYGLGIDNAIVDINAAELPAMDGSALLYCEMIREAGIKTQSASRQFLEVLRPVRVEKGDSFAEITPSSQLKINVSIDFVDPAIGRSQYYYNHTDTSFEAELAAARTFCLYADVTKLRAAGYALGGSLENAIVVDDGVIMNDDGLRYSDEFVRHKTLDCLGDIYLAGTHVLGDITASQPSHALNNLLLQAVLADEAAWRLVDSGCLQPAMSLETDHAAMVSFA